MIGYYDRQSCARIFGGQLTSTNKYRTLATLKSFTGKRFLQVNSKQRKMAAKKKHAVSELLTDQENDTLRELLGYKRFVSTAFCFLVMLHRE